MNLLCHFGQNEKTEKLFLEGGIIWTPFGQTKIKVNLEGQSKLTLR